VREAYARRQWRGRAGAGILASVLGLSAAALLLGAGFVAGALNVVAGGGSFLTLPVLIFLGLPAAEANATNRVAVLTQNAGAVWSFHRYRVMEWRRTGEVVVPALLGAAAGTWAALHVDDRDFRRLLAVVMVAVTLWTLLDPRTRGAGAPARPRLGPWGLRAGFLVVGLYGGFVQAGVGFLVLALTTLAGLDLVRGNALKVTAVLLLTALSLALFAGAGKVHWLPGLVMGAGSLLGSFLGARLTVRKGQRWIRAVVTGAVIVFAIALWVR
ncbi:MAG TPA: sulfite exporter TauE/SafE family protein, partial [Vicinamibacteria bacterium]|nr:sulfite exporter TauE/SafE family protein [Vicinamibacteria bacterium]